MVALVIPFVPVDWTPRVGELVENFGVVARVKALDAERGVLLSAVDFGGNVRWFADPAKCRPVR